MSKESLTKSPLVEVVFEIKFKDYQLVDYDILVGELYSKLKNKYAFSEPLKPVEMPSYLMPFAIQHRFRSVQDGYPLYQMGPGIVSFNMDGKTYEENTAKKWKTFEKKLLEFLKVYKEVLGDKFDEKNFDYLRLRFVNKIEDTVMYPEMRAYFTGKLNLKIDLDFADGVDFVNELEHNQLSQVYYLDKDKKSKFEFSIVTITEGSRKLIVDLAVSSKTVPTFLGIKKWLEDSHNSIDSFFKKLTSNIDYIVK